MKKIPLLLVSLISMQSVQAQESAKPAPEEPRHYMPLFIDIPAELNVQKGYQEFDLGAGYTDYKTQGVYRSLVEYDFAPVKNLGFEIEVPVTMVHSKKTENEDTALHGPSEAAEGLHNMAGLRIGVAYSFLSLPKAKLTITGGYFNELETRDLKSGEGRFIAGNIYNPFITVAKIWGGRLHTMLYTGPMISQEFEEKHLSTAWKINTTVAWRFGKGSKENFAGLEVNQSLSEGDVKLQTILRPQVQLCFHEQWALGVVGTIPIDIEGMGGGGFLRLIYQPRPGK